jgi:hypothetical protein
MSECTRLDYYVGALELHESLWHGAWGFDWARASYDAWRCWYEPFRARCLEKP